MSNENKNVSVSLNYSEGQGLPHLTLLHKMGDISVDAGVQLIHDGFSSLSIVTEASAVCDELKKKPLCSSALWNCLK